jgi:lysine-N-methylase
LKEVLQPDYVSKFACITSRCEDTCCRGWRVAIDQESYDKYINLMNTGDLFNGKITRDDIMQVEGAFAEVVLSDNTCPFLTEKKLCSIQEMYGESYLSLTCAIFPRNYNMVNGKLELTLNMSCPHAARLALLEPTPMKFSLAEIKDDPRIGKIPALDLSDPEYPNSVYPYFEEVRSFIVTLIQNRNYCFEDRLVILGRFCNDLNIADNRSGSDAVIRLINSYTHLIDNHGFDKFISSIPDQPTALLKTLMILIEYRLKTGVTGKRFLECFNQFKQGLNYTNEISDEDLSDSYKEVKSSCYDNFIKQNEYIFENYFVNYVFKELFPFGESKTIYNKDIFTVPKTIFTEYMLMAVHYAMIKNLLVGIAGYYKDQFGMQHVINLIQSFAKNIDHDVPYLQRLLKFFDDNQMINFACTAMLIKN